MRISVLLNRTRFLIPVVFLLLVATCLYAQDKGSAGRKQRKAEKVKEEQVKRQMKADKLGRKRHYKLQSKSVKSRWKKNKRRYKHVDAFDRRPGIMQRLFPRKRPESN